MIGGWPKPAISGWLEVTDGEGGATSRTRSTVTGTEARAAALSQSRQPRLWQRTVRRVPAGMAATIKHFPGHGSVAEDTHFDAAVDPRSLDELRASDLIPFADAIEAGAEAVMMAHVTYPAVDALPAGYSRRWIEDVLRGELGFHGVVVGDDIGMAAAEPLGSIAARIDAHLAAGCDLLLACSPAIVDESLAASVEHAPCDPARVARLQGAVASTWKSLEDNPQRRAFVERVTALDKAIA